MTDISTLRPINLFQKHGMDPLEISKLTGASEAEVYNSLHKARTIRIYRQKALATARKERLARRESNKRFIKYAGHPDILVCRDYEQKAVPAKAHSNGDALHR